MKCKQNELIWRPLTVSHWFQPAFICSESTIVTHWRRSDVFIVSFKHISHLVPVFLLLPLNLLVEAHSKFCQISKMEFFLCNLQKALFHMFDRILNMTLLVAQPNKVSVALFSKTVFKVWKTGYGFFQKYICDTKHHTERYFVYLRIQSECGKIRTRKTPNTNTYHAVKVKSYLSLY